MIDIKEKLSKMFNPNIIGMFNELTKYCWKEDYLGLHYC